MAITSLNYFDTTSVSDSTQIRSTIALSNLVSRIQNVQSDPYFDSTAKIGSVYIYYTHEDGRQQKKLVHDATNHQATVFWTPNARDGTWQKTELKVFDKDGAVIFLDRTNIGSEEDLTHSDGETYLNIT